MTNYLSTEQIIAIHRRHIIETGGADGIRDRAALESAALRPQTGYYADIIEMAAALIESLAVNHPFVDGNKRAAFASADTFLMMNGYRLEIEPAETYRFVIELFETGTFNFTAIERWLRMNAVQLKQP